MHHQCPSGSWLCLKFVIVHQHSKGPGAGCRQQLLPTGGPVGLLLQHAASQCDTSDIEIHNTRCLVNANACRAKTTSAHTSIEMPPQKHTPSTQRFVKPAAAVRCKHTFYESFEAAQQAQSTQVTEVSEGAQADVRKLGFLDVHAGSAPCEHTHRCILIVTMYLHVRSDDTHEP